jgi:hypothetical protein
MMRSKHNPNGGNTDDEGRLGTPAQRPVAFGGQRMANDPGISMRRGERTQRLGYSGMSDRRWQWGQSTNTNATVVGRNEWNTRKRPNLGNKRRN